jgi:opacity protein-like surface antigen
MRRIILTALLAVVFLGLSTAAAAQDWYHDRDARYSGEQWRSHVFTEVRTDLDHVWSEKHASDKERERLDRTKQELTELQAKLDHGEWDNGHVNDVIDSLRKSANDNRLSERDRSVLNDDVNRSRELQDAHNQRR